MRKYLLLTDKEEILNKFNQIVVSLKIREDFDYGWTSGNFDFVRDMHKSFNSWLYNPIEPIDIKDPNLYKYKIIFSLHCKQLFPKELVEKVRCINIHPGYNPYNRGWYPQVFSILNDLPFGATIHEIDSKIDHGNIIVQRKIDIELYDTSLSVYEKVVGVEMDLLRESLIDIINNNYFFTKIPEEGNINYKKDFNKLKEIDVNDKDTFMNHITKLRALSHGNFKNAYFIDEKGNKIFIKIELTKE
jgi:methionyl-tRNA formyltransferase